MTVGNLRTDNSWLTNLSNTLGNAISPQQQTQPMGGQMTANGYFPPAPGAAQQTQQQGGFLSQLMGKLPQNQFAINPMMNSNVRLGG
jgi:hypothetical protein